MCASSASLSRNGMRARFTNSALPIVRCSRDIQTVGQVRPLHAGEVMVARRALGNSSRTFATKPFNRSARSSCAFHQPRPKITGNRSDEVPEVCSSSTRFFSSNISSDCPAGRKFRGKSFRISGFAINGRRWKQSKIRAFAIGPRKRIAIERHLAPARKKLFQLRELTRFADDFRCRQHGRNIHATCQMQTADEPLLRAGRRKNQAGANLSASAPEFRRRARGWPCLWRVSSPGL